MRIFLSTLILSLLSLTSIRAQIFDPAFSTGGIVNPVEWEARIEKQNDSVYHLIYTATLEDGWHLYSQHRAAEDGPLATEFSFNDTPDTYELLGETREPDVEPRFDPVFQMDVKFFKEEVSFVQPIKVLDPDLTQVESEVL